MIHRTGSRRNHTFKKLEINIKTNGKAKTAAAADTSNTDMDTEVKLNVYYIFNLRDRN
jgi:hypothetical protein